MGEFELVKVGVSRFDPRDPYHFALTISWPGFVLYVFSFYFLITALFAALYLANPGSIAGARPGSVSDAFFFSIETLATVGYGEMSPANFTGHLISAAEIVTGMAFTAIMTGLIFVRFSKPKAKIFYADKVVVTAHNGRPTLMVRIGNGRANMLTNAQMQLNALIRQTSEEGLSAYNVHELKLLRDKVPSFPLMLTLMHTIDEASPLYGYDTEALAAAAVRLFLSIEARDPALAAVVHDLRTYSFEDIVFGMRYVDAVSVDDHGRPLADMTKISQLEPDSEPQRPPPARSGVRVGVQVGLR
jgi:inward rectifier potassium channel